MEFWKLNELDLNNAPTGALDSKTSKEIMNVLKKLNENGQTIVLITHNLEVAKIANKIYKIKDGKLSRGEKNENK